MRLTSSQSDQRGFIAAASSLPPVGSTLVVMALLLAVFELDRTTSSAPVQHLYYLPIVLAGINFRMRGGLGAALAAIVLYHVAHPHLLTFRYEQSDLVQVVLFIAVGGLAAKLTRDAHRLQALAMTDDLTGLHNLRSFEARLSAIIRTSRENRTPVSLLVLDLDRLKRLNDRYGHLAGAEAVRAVGHLIGGRLPADAVACRYGGDEFVVALPRCSAGEARRIAEDLRGAVHATAPILAAIPFPAGTLSISIGLACRVPDRTDGGHGESGRALFRAADAALYLAKATGRNHVSVA